MVGNPFSTRHVRPGALPYLFPAGETTDELVRRLREQNWWGQIVGPHGSGKSTLLATLKPRLAAAGRDLICVALHDGQRALPDLAWPPVIQPTTQVVVDGYEQLGRWSRMRLKQRCRQRQAGLLVTSHQDVGLPTLFETHVDAALAWQVVHQLSPEAARRAGPAQVAELLLAHQGNLRELLFAMYDFCERRDA